MFKSERYVIAARDDHWLLCTRMADLGRRTRMPAGRGNHCATYGLPGADGNSGAVHIAAGAEGTVTFEPVPTTGCDPAGFRRRPPRTFAIVAMVRGRERGAVPR